MKDGQENTARTGFVVISDHESRGSAGEGPLYVMITGEAPAGTSVVPGSADEVSADGETEDEEPTPGLETELSAMVEFITAQHPEMTPHPVVLYLDDDGDYEAVQSALLDAIDAFGLKLVMVGRPIRGSIWQPFIAIFKRQTAAERLEQAGDALTAGAKARWYGEPMSQITKAQGEAIAGLLNSLQNTQNALLTFSNILLVKIDGVPIVRELTPEQVEHLQKNPRLYGDPRLALGVLDDGPSQVKTVGSSKDPHAVVP
ncbi:hypothetical protein [Planotetraspora silvatica]|nr:hypothetical protein [Planotetraspora silvatica]